ncbi:C40 family peptidase [Planomonospora sp. ID67723]|uniref:C40 family peptidase n=1 Tax=Planomonospora sp. ID67723 TaxID=2738134 RepID=UPI001E62F049|nr:NlpC/P60 family protein [Planomonospora sp. ID67723]
MASTTTAQAANVVVTSGSDAQAALSYAYKQLGKDYCYGGTGPSCFDSAGLTKKAWAAGGVTLPRTTYGQYADTRRVNYSSLRPGDLVFFSGLGHVGIYVGAGKFIHAPSSGKKIQITSMATGYYRREYYGAGRP